jgi:hypothetical protein
MSLRLAMLIAIGPLPGGHESSPGALREIKGDADAAEERKALNDYLALIEQEAATSDKLSDALTEKAITSAFVDLSRSDQV